MGIYGFKNFICKTKNINKLIKFFFTCTHILGNHYIFLESSLAADPHRLGTLWTRQRHLLFRRHLQRVHHLQVGTKRHIHTYSLGRVSENFVRHVPYQGGGLPPSLLSFFRRNVKDIEHALKRFLFKRFFCIVKYLWTMESKSYFSFFVL